MDTQKLEIKKRNGSGSYIEFARYRMIDKSSHYLIAGIARQDPRRCDNANFFRNGCVGSWTRPTVFQVVAITHVLIPAVRP